MNTKLNKINFEKIIELDLENIKDYSIENYFQNNSKHPIKGFCTLCEEEGCNIAIDDNHFKLTNISHGAHALDFIDAVEGQKPDITGWHDEPIIFLFETPSLDYDIYEDVQYKEIKKRPSKEWYWIHKKKDLTQYPQHYKGGEYGNLIFSIINTLKLKNVYMTNLVKCGMNNKKGKFEGIASYSEKCKSICYQNILKKEIEAMGKPIIFTIGSSVHANITSLLENDSKIAKDYYTLINLPHPAGRRRGFKDEFYRALYFWVVVEGLYKSNVLDDKELKELALTYVKATI